MVDGGDRRSRHKVDADVLEPAGDQLADGRAEATLLGTILVADHGHVDAALGEAGCYLAAHEAGPDDGDRSTGTDALE